MGLLSAVALVVVEVITVNVEIIVVVVSLGAAVVVVVVVVVAELAIVGHNLSACMLQTYPFFFEQSQTFHISLSLVIKTQLLLLLLSLLFAISPPGM